MQSLLRYRLSRFGQSVIGVIALLPLAGTVACNDDSESITAPAPAAESNVAAEAASALTFQQVSAGGNHSCGVTTDNKAYCWGEGGVGELGDGNETSSSRPVAVAGDLRFVQINAGGAYTCGLTIDDRLYCWGDNSFGQLGDGTHFRRLTPTAIAGGRRWSQVDAGDRHTCGVTISQKAFCWGDNFFGQLGNGTTTGPETCPVFDAACSTRPVSVLGGHLFRQVSAGSGLTCGASSNFQAFCWGSGPLGTGGTVEAASTTPRRVLTTREFKLVRAGGLHNCGLTRDDQAFCWGHDELGQLGNGTTSGVDAGSAVPVRVAGGHVFSGLSVDVDRFSCATTSDNRAFCWGVNDFGQLGRGTHTGPEQCAAAEIPCSTRPVAVVGGLLFRQVDVGAGHSCGVTTGGRAFCWGANHEGQLGNGTNTGPESCGEFAECSSKPVEVVAPDS